jgi:aerobic-type carbon monoxide dehydrogenase small subunit (CoxS/CutS family)
MTDPDMILMDLIVNGNKVAMVVKAGRRLIDFLREDLHLTGSKEGCGEGECGSCTVLLNNQSVLACLTPID